MKNHLLFLFTLVFLGVGTTVYAQPDCVTLLTPVHNATDQDLTLDLTWEAALTGDTPTMYNVYLGTTSGSLGLAQNTTTTAALLTGLLINTTYYWRIEAMSAGGTTSGCTEFSFTTLGIPSGPGVSCGAATPIEFLDDMETNATWTGDWGTGTTTNMWNVRTGQTPTGNTGPDGAHSGSNYFYYESSSTSTDQSIVSPAVDLSLASGTVEFTFYFHAFGASISTLDVGIGTSPTGPFTSIWTWTGQFQSAMTDPWQIAGFDLSAYAGQTIYMQYSNIVGGVDGSFGDLAIDLMEVHACEFAVPVNDECASPKVLATSGQPGMIVDENTATATNSGVGIPACNTSAGNDLYYSVETDVDGGALYIDVASLASSRYTIVLYEGSCGSLTELACSRASSTGTSVQLAYFASGLTSGEGSASRSAPQNFVVRVYDENEAGENFTISASGSALAALPVKLTDFWAKLMQNSIMLEWETEQEFNTDRFIVEKSLDGSRWFAAMEKKAVGFSDLPSSYSMEDFDLAKRLYYRLRIVDNDAYEELSGIVLITRDDLDITVFPNPASSVIQIDGIQLEEEAVLRIFNRMGQLVHESRTGSNEIDVQSLSRGLYSIVIEHESKLYQRNFIKE